MRAILLVGLALIASCVASPAAPKVEPQLYYHDAVGFELAARIKANEEVAMKKLLEDAIRGEPLQQSGNRIVGGGAAASNSYPFMVRFFETDQNYYCIEAVLLTRNNHFKMYLGIYTMFFNGILIYRHCGKRHGHSVTEDIADIPVYPISHSFSH